MGKSPAKWIKAVLLGKKSSKSSVSKNVIVERKAAAKTSAGDPAPIVSDLSSEDVNRGVENTEIEKGTTASPPSDEASMLPVNETGDLQGSTTLSAADAAEIRRQEQAATKAQAAFRGYLARRAFWALKGIIRLQALIRGHLVRRQAVATLHSMQAVVKFQALARGRKARMLYPELQLPRKYKLGEIKDSRRADMLGANMSQKLATNKFVRKLLASLPTAMPLSLQYDSAEPNSAWNWLQRWSVLRFWEPLPQPKKIRDTKSHTKQGSSQSVEPQTARSRRTVRKAPTVFSSDSNQSNSLEIEKTKRNARKIVTHQTEPAQDNPQNELERVKRSLRKVSASTVMASEKSEIETEKALDSPMNMPNSSAVDISDQGGVKSSENLNVPPVTVDKPYSTQAPSKLSSLDVPEQLSSTEPVPKLPSTESPPKVSSTEGPSEPLPVDEEVDVIQEDHLVEKKYSDNGGKDEIKHTVNEEISSKEEDQTSKENQKSRRRRSLPAKQEYPENVSQNTSSLPSYMAATQSAKAKLRGQSPRLAEDGTGTGNGTENGFVRRHSLPSSTNGKVASLSPRVQRPLQANGKGGIKSNKQLSSSKDDKVLQPGWRR